MNFPFLAHEAIEVYWIQPGGSILAQAEWWIAIGDQQECVGVHPQAPATDPNHKVRSVRSKPLFGPTRVSYSNAEITRQRVQDMSFIYFSWPFMAFNLLAMMLLGLYAGAQRIYDGIPHCVPLIRRLWIWGLIVGVIGNLVYVIAGQVSNRSDPSPQLILALIGQTFGAPALSIFYMTSLVLLTQAARWERRLQPLANVGRMAISNYLLQTLICTTLFYGYGFGLYGQVGAAAGVLLTIAIYALQVPLSVWWLRHFRFGPVEWLWRSLTYGQHQPMRYPPADTSGRSRPASLGGRP
jgi:uncharacterized protein